MPEVLHLTLLWVCLGTGVRSSAIDVPEATPPSNSNCEFWCKTPYNAFYCCDNDGETVTPEEPEHDGECPQVRSECPGIYKNLPGTLPDFDIYGLPYPDDPKICAHDSVCSAWEKCCFDRCFDRHVCKFAYSTDTDVEYSESAFRDGDIVQEATYLLG
nr:uncharacterized protein LOC113811778 isoform X2 [Penaeus vannamei]